MPENRPRQRSVSTLGAVGSAALLLWVMGLARVPDPINHELVVYGGTPAGVMAAVAGAREGLSVVLLEPGKRIGGMVAGGLSRTDHGVKDVIGGYSREFFERVGKHYGEPVTWYFEPRVAEQVFHEMLREAGVRVLLQHRLRERTGVRRRGTRIDSITLENGSTFRASVFTDATYEGDLMAQSGVSYTWGREASNEFGESLAGVRESTLSHQFMVHVSPFDVRGRLLPEVSPGPRGKPGSADRKVQAYNFRLCMTDRSDNRVPVPRPARYDARRYALLARMLAEVDRQKRGVENGTAFHLASGSAPQCCISKEQWSFGDVVRRDPTRNGKVDINNYGAFSTDYIAGNYGYPDGNYRVRDRIWREHVAYVQGFLFFIANDTTVPRGLRDAVREWGLCRDEFVATGHWPHQLYVREARRMRGELVMSQKDIQAELTKSDAIGMGSYNSDSHNVQRVAMPEGWIENEGDMQVEVRPYQIPYRMILPRRAEIANLLVPVAFSATHVAYSTLRMEPQYMILGHAAGVAANLAVSSGSALHDINVAALMSTLRHQGAVLEYNSATSR